MFKRLPSADPAPARTAVPHANVRAGRHGLLRWLSRTGGEVLPSRGLRPRTVQHRHHEERNGDNRKINRLEPAIKDDHAAFREHDPDVRRTLRRLMHAAMRCVHGSRRRGILLQGTSCRRNIAVSCARRTVDG